ncbi:MAG: excinuclease ABC subunit UvrC, partial [Deltaproteobacteria bacterium]|nr:excinuclease ABC subunit UvrC [Deltaproteobacteria bacterium]
MDLADQVSVLPHLPGVYLFKDGKGKVLYVGKAKDLRKRVASYAKGRDERSQVVFLLRRTKNLETIVTDTEKEALLLENTLIKQHRPPYNITFRDDKTYVSIRIGTEHSSSGIHLVRRVVKDGATYFGPYASGTAAREAVQRITQIFRLRTCSDTEFANRVRPCILYDIGRCTGPCVGRVTPQAYAAQVEAARMFLSGKSRELVKQLTDQMQQSSRDERFEEAARLRDAITLVRDVLERQKVVVHRGGDYDAIGTAGDPEHMAMAILTIRGGTLLDQKVFGFERRVEDEHHLLSLFLVQRYAGRTDVPSEIVLPMTLPDRIALTDILTERRGTPVMLTTPHRGIKVQMVKLAAKNAREFLAQRGDDQKSGTKLLEHVGKKLGVDGAARIIECLDISNLQGREAYGSLICFVEGRPAKDRYRLYTIRTLSTPDDYRMMREVLLRRFGNLARADRPQSVVLPPPDLLLVDGGKGQLNIATKVLADIGVHNLPVAAIAKGQSKGEDDHVYLPNRKNPVTFRHGSPELLFLMRIRDEAHRFGITAHRRRRGKVIVPKFCLSPPAKELAMP